MLQRGRPMRQTYERCAFNLALDAADPPKLIFWRIKFVDKNYPCVVNPTIVLLRDYCSTSPTKALPAGIGD
jgi:hypothetical protein